MKNIFYIGVPSGVENGMFQLGRLVLFARADTLAHNRGKAQVDGLTGKAVEVCDGVADGVRHHRRRAERRDQAEEHEASQLEHTVST